MIEIELGFRYKAVITSEFPDDMADYRGFPINFYVDFYYRGLHKGSILFWSQAQYYHGKGFVSLNLRCQSVDLEDLISFGFPINLLHIDTFREKLHGTMFEDRAKEIFEEIYQVFNDEFLKDEESDTEEEESLQCDTE